MKKTLIFGLLLTLVFFSCLPKQEIVRPTNAVRSPSASSPRPGTSPIGHQYISRYKDIAIEEMHRHGIPASIKLAQGLLESGNGTSALARNSNNHFGIKCTSDWSGGKTYHNDDAENDCFRVYRMPEESFRDHSQFLLRRRYENLFKLNPSDYKGWARGLKDAGYATNPRYADLLIDIIERYELFHFDQAAALPTQPTVAEHKQNQHTAVQKPPVTMKIHEVKTGENLADIASRYGLTPQEILQINGLRSHDVHPGQLLVVSKM